MHAAGACAAPAAGAARCSQLRAQRSVRGAALPLAPRGGHLRGAPRLRLPARAAISVDRRSVLEARWARQAVRARRARGASRAQRRALHQAQHAAWPFVQKAARRSPAGGAAFRR
jgi:hypothetical protein